MSCSVCILVTIQPRAYRSIRNGYTIRLRALLLRREDDAPKRQQFSSRVVRCIPQQNHSLLLLSVTAYVDDERLYSEIKRVIGDIILAVPLLVFAIGSFAVNIRIRFSMRAVLGSGWHDEVPVHSVTIAIDAGLTSFEFPRRKQSFVR